MGKRSIAFSERLYGLVVMVGDNNKSFAQAIGISENSATNYLKKGRIPEPDILVRISEHYKKSTDWLLQDLFEKKIKEKSGESNIVEIQHANIIKKFKDKERAKELNEVLVEIESLREDAFQKVETYVRGVADGLRAAQSSDKPGTNRKRSNTGR